MRYSFITSALLAATSVSATLSPEQSSALQAAASSYVASVAKSPLFTSIVSELAQVTGSALDGVNGIKSLIGGATPTGGVAQIDSYIAELPSDASSFFASITSAEAALLNGMLATMTTATPSSSSSVIVTPTPTPTPSYNTTATASWTGYANSTATTSKGVKTLTSVVVATGSTSATTTSPAAAVTSKSAAVAAAGAKIGSALFLGVAAVVAML